VAGKLRRGDGAGAGQGMTRAGEQLMAIIYGAGCLDRGLQAAG
jgi:hypothetical protein